MTHYSFYEFRKIKLWVGCVFFNKIKLPLVCLVLILFSLMNSFFFKFCLRCLRLLYLLLSIATWKVLAYKVYLFLVVMVIIFFSYFLCNYSYSPTHPAHIMNFKTFIFSSRFNQTVHFCFIWMAFVYFFDGWLLGFYVVCVWVSFKVLHIFLKSHKNRDGKNKDGNKQ